MAILTRDEAQALVKKVLGYSKAEGCVVNFGGGSQNNIRFARNSVTTSGVVDNMNLAVSSNFGKRQGIATINEFDDASLERVVRRSEEVAKLAPENPEFMPPLEPRKYLESKAFFDSTSKLTPEYRTAAAAHAILPAREKKLVAAGYLNDSASFEAMGNNTGLFAYHAGTDVNFSTTMRTPDGTGSGWASRDFNDVSKLDTQSVSQIALKKAMMSREPKAIEPGKYTVILEPAGSVDILGSMFFGFDARQTDEGRSFLSKAGGGTKLGEKIADERVTIYCDPTHPEIPSSTWDASGQPIKKLTMVEKGVVKNLIYSRYWAEKKEVDPVPAPTNGIMMGGDVSTEEMIKSTKKGILVTRTWYIRTVDPQTVLVTGLTRDGTFFIENGEIAFPIKNMRFNESPVIMLNNIEALGRPQRIDGSLIPPMKLRDFTFTSLSDAI